MAHLTRNYRTAARFYTLADQFEWSLRHMARRSVISGREFNSLVDRASQVERAYSATAYALSGRALEQVKARRAEIQRLFPASYRRPKRRVHQTRTPLITLFHTIRESKSLRDCFRQFSTLEREDQLRIYQLLCAHFEYEAPLDVVQRGIDLFLDDPRRLVTPLARVKKCILQIVAQERAAAHLDTESQLQQVIARTAPFDDYRIYAGKTTLTSMYMRPANLFFDALLGPKCTTMPGSGQLFAFLYPHGQIREYIQQQAAANPEEVVTVSAARFPTLAPIYGKDAFRLSFDEVESILSSQRIFLSPRLPRNFYRALKRAMLLDRIVTLPGTDSAPIKVKSMPGRSCQALFKEARKNPFRFGFNSLHELLSLLDLTIYQLGTMVVKSEDFHIFMDAKGKILARNPGAPDAIRLLNACGIRGLQSTPLNRPISHKMLMTDTFRTALIAAEQGIIVFPAVGMGVWGGDPDLYWRAFLEAVMVSGDRIEKILVNPGHRSSPTGIYRGCTGNEFQPILDGYKQRYPYNANLKKIVNLYQKKTDVIHLAHNLKKQFPEKTISLFNASDPDVTLGNHVGQYTNNLGHAATTEENYTAMGTNGLCFEGITGVLNDPKRIIQTNFDMATPTRGRYPLVHSLSRIKN